MSMSCLFWWPRHTEATDETSLVCSMIFLKRPRPSSATLATLSRTLLTTSRCSNSLLRTSLHNPTRIWTKQMRTRRSSRRRWKLVWSIFGGWVAPKWRSITWRPWRLLRRGLKALADATQAARQERALCRGRSAHFAHLPQSWCLVLGLARSPSQRWRVWSRTSSRSCRQKPRL